MVNAGAVFRHGALVERPAPRAPALHAHLLALEEHGFDRPEARSYRIPSLGFFYREQLTFIRRVDSAPPFPRWVMTESRVEIGGRLLRRLA
ncbi:hypothetical protein LT493_27110 [Streptomyces tricolor]|nr:hypothetical protein [Streptomyces tricolor]